MNAPGQSLYERAREVFGHELTWLELPSGTRDSWADVERRTYEAFMEDDEMFANYRNRVKAAIVHAIDQTPLA